MSIADIANLIIGAEYALVDNKNQITVSYFQKLVDDCLYFYDHYGHQTIIYLWDAKYYGDHTNMDGMYCIYDTDDYLNDQAVFDYSKTIKGQQSISSLIGKTFLRVYQDDDGIIFENKELTVRLAHIRQCCETVWLEDVNGDLSDLENFPIVRAEEKYGKSEDESWYFYTLATKNGYVDLRFCAELDTMYSTNATLDWRFNK